MSTVNKIFPAPVLRIQKLLSASEVAQASELALKANERLNDHQVPYSRTYRDSLDFMYPEYFKPIFRRLRRHIEDEFKCNVSSMVGRESIFRYGQHLPFHTEPHADISCVLWLDFPAKPDPTGKTPGTVLMDSAWTSGELSLKHHSLEDNCESCHTAAFESVQDETCISCHKDTGDHAPMPRLAKGAPALTPGDALQWRIAEGFGKEGPLGCVSCHSEHEGPKRQPAGGEAFCSDCHNTLDTRLTDTALANAHDFGKGHPQFRPAYFASFGAAKPVRAAAGTKPVERSGLVFPHNVHMDARGGAARMAVSLQQYGKPLECSDCHVLTPDRISFKAVQMEDACEGCHSLVSGRIAGGGFGKLRHGGEPVDGIWFGHADPLPARVRLAYRLDADEWQGQKRVRFLVEGAEI